MESNVKTYSYMLQTVDDDDCLRKEIRHSLSSRESTATALEQDVLLIMKYPTIKGS